MVVGEKWPKVVKEPSSSWKKNVPLLWFWDSPKKKHTSFQKCCSHHFFMTETNIFKGSCGNWLPFLMRCFNDPSWSIRFSCTQKNVFRLSGTCLHIGWYALNSLGCICTNLLQLRCLAVETSDVLLSRWCLTGTPGGCKCIKGCCNCGLQLQSDEFSKFSTWPLLSVHYADFCIIVTQSFWRLVFGPLPIMICVFSSKKARDVRGSSMFIPFESFGLQKSVPQSFPTVMIWMNSSKFHPCLVQISIWRNVQQFGLAFFKEPRSHGNFRKFQKKRGILRIPWWISSDPGLIDAMSSGGNLPCGEAEAHVWLYAETNSVFFTPEKWIAWKTRIVSFRFFLGMESNLAGAFCFKVVYFVEKKKCLKVWRHALHTSIKLPSQKKDKDLTAKLMFTTFMFRENQNLGLGKKKRPHSTRLKKGRGKKTKLRKTAPAGRSQVGSKGWKRRKMANG